jgi:2-haloacid dehalogenase
LTAATSVPSVPSVRAVVFDLGGVLIDWDPRHLYRRLFRGDEAAVERFLSEVCTPEWNEEQDGGRSFAEGIALLQARHPEHVELIAAYRDCWEEMIPGCLDGGPELLAEVKRAGFPVYALSNWSAETYPIAERRFEFLSRFDGVVISGRVGLRKPDPAIYRHLLDVHALEPTSTLFIDDSERNVRAARAVGLPALHFWGMAQLRSELRALRVLPPVGGGQD